MKKFPLPSLPHFLLPRSASQYPAAQLYPHTSSQSIHYTRIRPVAQLDRFDTMKTIPTNHRKAHSQVKPIVIYADETATPEPVIPTKPVKPITDVEVIDLTDLPFPGVKKNRPKDINRTIRRILFRGRSTASIDNSPKDEPTDATETNLASPIDDFSDASETDVSSFSDYLTDATETGLSSPDDYLTNTDDTVLSLRKSTVPPAPVLETPQAVINANNIGLLDDPIDRNCPIDASQLYVDSNGNEQSTQFLLPIPMKFIGVSSYQNSELNYFRRWRYGMTRPIAIERFAAMARHQQPIRLINTQAEITTAQYHELADQFIDSLVDKLEGLEEQHEEIEVEYNVSRCCSFFLPPHFISLIVNQSSTRKKKQPIYRN